MNNHCRILDNACEVQVEYPIEVDACPFDLELLFLRKGAPWMATTNSRGNRLNRKMIGSRQNIAQNRQKYTQDM